MSMPENLALLEGQWMGVNRLWLTPDAETIVSEAEARVELEAHGSFLSIRYTWVYADVIQEGLLLIGGEKEDGRVNAAWLDSWHYAGEMMVLGGKRNQDDSLAVTGSYPAPTGPDWGWWITLHPISVDQFQLIMHNVPPGAEAVKAVEISFERLE